MACSTTGSFDVRTGANVKYQRESHTLLKDRDVQMRWNGELTSGNARVALVVAASTATTSFAWDAASSLCAHFNAIGPMRPPLTR